MHAVERTNECRLTASGWADQCGDAVLAHAQRHIFDRLKRAVIDVQIFGKQLRGAGEFLLRCRGHCHDYFPVSRLVRPRPSNLAPRLKIKTIAIKTSAEPLPTRSASGTRLSECVYHRCTESVSAGWNGLKSYPLIPGETLVPAVKISAAVSPKIRPAIKITPVVSDAIALGNTTLRIVCHFVAPSAIEPSRNA